MTTELENALAKLADKLGTSVDKIYTVLTKQSKIDAIIGVAYFIMLIVATYFLYHGWEHIVPLCKPENPTAQYSFQREWPGNIQLAVAGLGIVTLAIIILSIVWVSECFSQILTAIFNPEAYAIERILNSIN